MKIRNFVGIVLIASLTLTACDDTTNELGTSLTDKMDQLNISTDTFEVSTRSIIADSVLSRNTTGYLGRVRDPETGAYITSDYMTQFHILDNYQFPPVDSMLSKEGGEIIADSCEIRLYYTNFYGDSLTAMKLTAYEMNKPMEEGRLYYSNFDPMKEGYASSGNFNTDKTYTLADLNVSPQTKKTSGYVNNIRVRLDKPYTDSNGTTYNNYGTYIIRKYYQHPEYFKNSYQFIHNVVPGFYIKSTNGLGAMAYVYLTQLNLYFRYLNKDTTAVGTTSFAGTEEVLQTSNIVNDGNTIKRLAADNTCTYLKTPAGIFTEMTLPIDSIMKGHTRDTINTAKVTFERINNSSTSDYALGIPQTLLMIPKERMNTFFEKNEIADFKTSFIATFDKKTNTYVFNNIGSLIKDMATNKNSYKEEHWGKVVIIPITTTYNTSSDNQTRTLTKVVHDMSMASTRLVGGSENKNNKIKLSVIYSKFK